MKKKVYVNPKQAAFLNATQKRRSFHAGRGGGKSSVLGFNEYLKFNYLPRSKGFLGALTYKQALTKTLPSAMESWAQIGLKEHTGDKPEEQGHYVVCKKPPTSWVKPYQPPRDYSNSITFINGRTKEILSADRPDLLRGGNYDDGDIDESALMKRDIVYKVLMPMIRGNIFRFDHPLHQTFCDYSSAAWLPSGQWIYETEQLAKEFPEEYLYIEGSAKDNIEVLGPGYIEKLRREMSDLEFQVEVENKRIKKLPNGFYPAFDENKHCVTDTYGYDHDDKTGLWLIKDSFYNPNLPLQPSFDFNAAFTSLSLWQENGDEFRQVDELWVKDSTQSKVTELCEKLINSYSSHLCKVMFVHGDRNGNNRLVNSPNTFYEEVKIILEKAGWEVNLCVEGLDPNHRLKHLVINEILSEKRANLPKIRINQDKCKYTIISIESAPILIDFQKNKNSEYENIPQERATHLSDTFDNIIYRKYKHLFGEDDSNWGLVYFM